MDMKMVKNTAFHSKLTKCFMLYDKLNSSNDVSIVSNGRGFQKINGQTVYVLSELQAISCDDQGSVDKIPLVYLPRKHLKQKVQLKFPNINIF